MGENNALISKLNKFSDVMLALGVVMIVMMMIIPLPPFLLDLLLALNITLSLTIVMISIYNVEPLQFSVFPSLLLVTTLFRLALNVSATRLILLRLPLLKSGIKTIDTTTKTATPSRIIKNGLLGITFPLFVQKKKAEAIF